jgi:phosphate-selective porin
VAALVAASIVASGPVAAQSGDADSDSTSTAGAGGDVQGRLESLAEQLQTLQADTDKLKRFKFSGYLQVRWEHAEDQSDSVKVGGSPIAITPNNRERVYIRRGRLKLTYDSSPLSQGVLYLDAGQDRTVRLLEAYVTLLDPWTPGHRHALTVGQINVPFGYELERSDSDHELPERSRAENVLFPGERDRGVKLVNAWTPRLETTVAILNGGGINHPNFPNTDPTSDKDWTARARWSQGVFDVAASYYGGHEVTPLTGPDAVTDKTRLGADAQIYFQLPSAGGGSLKGEFYSGKNVDADTAKALVVTVGSTVLLAPGATASRLEKKFQGGYGMWVQNLGDAFQLAARYDWFDPDLDTAHDRFERWGLGLNWFYDGFTRLTVAYDIPHTERPSGTGYVDPKDNAWTVQVQHKF